MSTQPNILFICTDQLTEGALSCAGNTDVHTPAIDSLAATGVRFTECYCSNPLCTPARASLFTGRMPHEIGIQGNGVQIPADVADSELGVLMQGGGYGCYYAGKWHVPEIAMPDGTHGFETIAGFDDFAVVESCSKFLSETHTSPFFVVASFDNPHNICEWARETPLPWSPNIEPPNPCECPDLPENFAISSKEPEPIRRIVDLQPKVYGTPSLTDDDWWRQLRYAYYRLVEHVDRQIGEILAALAASAYAENTLVIFTSDHGDANGAHQLKQKTFLYEEQTKVPLIVVPPNATQHVDDSSLVAGGLDVYATILDYAGIRALSDCDGRSIRNLVEPSKTEQSDTDRREAVFCETTTGQGSELAVDGRMVRTSRYKYNAYSWGRFREQLFDLEADPGELVNLAYSDEYAGVRDRHRALLLAWCQKTNDTFGSTYGHPGIPTVPGFEYI